MMTTQVSAQGVVNGYQMDSTYTVNTVGERYDKTVFEYDKNGNCTTEYEYSYFDSTEGYLSDKTITTYNEKNGVTGEESYSYEDGVATLEARTECSDFNADGQPTVMINYGIDDEAPEAGLQPQSKYVIAKFDGIAPVDAKIYQYDEGEWTEMGSMHFDYTSWGGVSKETTTFSFMGMALNETTTYEYDSHHNVTKEVSASDFGGGSTAEYVNSYDDRDLMVSRTEAYDGEPSFVSHFFWSKPGQNSIDAITAMRQAMRSCYDLKGRLHEQPQRSGVYILNGKKRLVK